jgi:hypothetical protein
MADFVSDPENGQGAVTFTIGLGNLINNAPSGDPDAGAQLLCYAATICEDPNAPDDMYYFAPDPAELSEIFRQIAENIATRLSQ